MTVTAKLIRGAGRSRPAAVIPSAASASNPVKTLLVVDDDSAVRRLEVQLLRLHGYKVLEAEGAAEALRLAGNARPIHLLITDFMMPEVDGVELTRQFRVAHPTIPVLMVSGSFPEFRDRIKNLDHFEFLAKPFAIAELLQKVRSLLSAAIPIPRRQPAFSG